jgi:ArsR family transcriptional regulator
MNRELAALCLSELGNLTRLDIYRLLVRASPNGLNVGEVQARLDIPASTLAFHLRGLVAAGLVVQERAGREVRCRANHRQVSLIVEFLREKCCMGFVDEVSARTRRRVA